MARSLVYRYFASILYK